MRARALLRPILLCLPLAAAARPRPAPLAPPPPTEAGQRATELTERAYELQRRGALNDAIRLYEEALKADPLPKRHRNLAIPLEQAGRLVEALIQYWRFQRDERGEPPLHRQDVAERVAALLPRLGRLRIAPPGEEAVVRVPAALDERPRCVSTAGQPLVGPLPAEPEGAGSGGEYLCQPGPIDVDLLIGGRPVASRRVTVSAGATAVVRFALRAPVRLRSNRPRPELLLDGAPLALPGPLPATLPTLIGPHHIEARQGREVVRRAFTVREGVGADVELRFRPRRTWLWLLVGGAALAVAGAAAGAAAYAATRPPEPGGADIALPPPM